MNVKKQLSGIIGVVNTPFNDDDSVDYESLRRYVNHSQASGVTGFLALGMAAEIDKLTTDEKKRIAHVLIDEVDGSTPVICGVSADTQAERLRLAEKFVEAGCDGIMVNLPFNDEALFRRQITDISNIGAEFLMIQDWDREKYGIPIPVLKKLFEEIDRFKCLKIEVAPAGLKYSEMLSVTDQKLRVSGGWAGDQMIEALDRGVDAFMPTVLHGIYRRIFQLHTAGKREEAKKLFFELVPILAFSHQHLDISIHFNKKLVHRQGIFSTDKVREPIQTFDNYHKNIADELIAKALNLSKSLKQGP